MAKKNRKRPSQFQNPLLSNASKTLFANIRFVSIDEKVKTIVVTSTGMDEGKTQVSTNLACAIASSGKKVLIVDTDMRRRCIAGLLGIHTECGLYSVLVGQAPLKSAIYPTDRPNLYFMDSEPNIPSPPDVLSTKRFAALVDTLREMFDYVIFDSPPIGLFVDAAIISNLVDGTLYVIRERAAKRDDVVAGVQQLKAANARILGSVITFSREEANNDYYYAYYNSEGKRVSRKDREKQLMENPNARDLTSANGRARPASIPSRQNAEKAASGHGGKTLGRFRVLAPALVRPRAQAHRGPLERAPTSSSRAAPSSRQCHAVPTVARHATRTRGSNAAPRAGSRSGLPAMLSNALRERGSRPAKRAGYTGLLHEQRRVQPTRAALPTTHTSRVAGSSLTSIIVRNTWQTTRRNRPKRTQPPSTRRHREPTHRARATAPTRNARKSRRSSCCSSC